MRVICPFVDDIEPDTVRALEREGYNWEAVEVSGSATAYTELFEQLWAAQQSFIVVEHDIVPFPGALRELVQCTEAWCAYRYLLAGGLHAGLGCTKFESRLMEQYPDAVTRTWSTGTLDARHPAGHWCRLDDRLTRGVLMNTYGVPRHVHDEAVEHLRPKASHGCI